MKGAALLLSLIAAAVPAVASAKPVLMISIDGLRPNDVLEAEKRGLAIPNLRRFLREGAYATGVTGVLPTLTYPSHTTLITGVSPARHGIVANNSFDPMQINQGGWTWYASDIRVPTLWEAAAKAGLTTGNVHWPVSVAAKGVTWNLPQIWRTGHADDVKLLDALATPGLKAELEEATGESYAAGIDESLSGDENRGRFAAALIAAHLPDFLTVYLTALDHEQHLKGVGSVEAKAVLERIDAIVGRLIAAELEAHPDAVIALVSDHGFDAVHHALNLFRPFIDDGLIVLNKDGQIASWQAMPWISGGSAAIMLARPKDDALIARVKAVLDRLAGDPANGVARIADRQVVMDMGGNPAATFYLDLARGFVTDSFRGANAPTVSETSLKAMHGYFPGDPELMSTFMLLGEGVAKGRRWGQIDMRAVPSTLAEIMGFQLTDAEQKAVSWRP
ncbi:ectonucleotide pyrophosphatase/phosphodiesterase [Sphingobium sp.]|uniref:ectonucleotide pyrophosphatase/phosphodiesterase n=1 Tax=Sphingobium sp. TaxID=1912891 RepID=UPI0035C6BF8E